MTVLKFRTTTDIIDRIITDKFIRSDRRTCLWSHENGYSNMPEHVLSWFLPPQAPSIAGISQEDSTAPSATMKRSSATMRILRLRISIGVALIEKAIRATLSGQRGSGWQPQSRKALGMVGLWRLPPEIDAERS